MVCRHSLPIGDGLERTKTPASSESGRSGSPRAPGVATAVAAHYRLLFRTSVDGQSVYLLTANRTALECRLWEQAAPPICSAVRLRDGGFGYQSGPVPRSSLSHLARRGGACPMSPTRHLLSALVVLVVVALALVAAGCAAGSTTTTMTQAVTPAQAESSPEVRSDRGSATAAFTTTTQATTTSTVPPPTTAGGPPAPVAMFRSDPAHTVYREWWIEP